MLNEVSLFGDPDKALRSLGIEGLASCPKLEIPKLELHGRGNSLLQRRLPFCLLTSLNHLAFTVYFFFIV